MPQAMEATLTRATMQVVCGYMEISLNVLQSLVSRYLSQFIVANYFDIH